MVIPSTFMRSLWLSKQSFSPVHNLYRSSPCVSFNIQNTRFASNFQVVSSSQHATPNEDHFDKQSRLKRPMSPHLTIYKPQLTSILSIGHRASGVFQALCLSGFGLSTLALSTSFPVFFESLQAMHYGPAIIFTAKFVIAWPVAYHFLNGIRHLGWDIGKGFQIGDLYKSGALVFATSVVLGLAIAAM